MESANYNDNNSKTSEPLDSNCKEISFKKGPKGFGFNIIGGIDQPYIPGNFGFFISRIRPSGAAFADGRLSIGDGLISVNGIKLLGLTHDEVVNIFNRISSGGLAQLLVEKNAEKNILKEASESTTFFNSRLNSAMSSGDVEIDRTPSGDYSTALPTPTEAVIVVPSSPNGSVIGTAKTTGESSPEDSVNKDPPTVTDTNEFPYLSQTVPNPYVPPPSVVAVDDTEEFPPLNGDNNEKASENNKQVTENNKQASDNKEQVNDEAATLKVFKPELTSNHQIQSSTPSYAAKAAENIGTYASIAAHNVTTKPTINVLSDDRADGGSGDSGQFNINSVDGKDPQSSPKRSPFHLNHNSVWTEVFFVTVGTVALGAIVFFGYRFIKRR